MELNVLYVKSQYGLFYDQPLTLFFRMVDEKISFRAGLGTGTYSETNKSTLFICDEYLIQIFFENSSDGLITKNRKAFVSEMKKLKRINRESTHLEYHSSETDELEYPDFTG